MKMGVIKSLQRIQDEVACIRNLYINDPDGCFFVTEHKLLDDPDNSGGQCRIPVVELRDWSFDDIFEIMKLNMNLPETEVDDFIDVLKAIRQWSEWRPLIIGAEIVVVEPRSREECKQQQIRSLVERFQETRDFQSAPSEWGGIWLGPQ